MKKTKNKKTKKKNHAECKQARGTRMCPARKTALTTLPSNLMATVSLLLENISLLVHSGKFLVMG